MRREAIERHRAHRGGKVLAVLPIHYPKPLLTAMNVLAVELWGPPGPPRGVQAGRIQPYICPVVRNALAFLSHGPMELVDGVLFTNTCDAIQGLATLLPDLGDWHKPVMRCWYPVGERRISAARFLETELQALADRLAQLTGSPLDLDRLAWALDLHRQIDALRADILDRRAHLDLSDRELYALLREGEYRWPEDHLERLRSLHQRLAELPVKKGLPVMITGLVPEPMGLFTALEEAGAFVAADDYAGIGRRIVRQPPPASTEPWTDLVEWIYHYPPCSTQGGDLARRLAHLEERYQQGGCVGLIIHATKFCEPEAFDFSAIRKSFSARQRPVLYLESELEVELSGQQVTRLEAFGEMIAQKQGAQPC
ncbi:MAG: 2-hydroxyacyl-CoA dehydratase [Bradymonadales bacterium]|nr:2-hydroxyacyl-CoA dehydratase [Bradymonadales bacterium]